MIPERTSEDLLRTFLDSLGTATKQAPVSADALEWLALVPLWPEQVAVRGFPSASGMVTGDDVHNMLEEFFDNGSVDCTDATPPWSGKVYRMSRSQRRRVFQSVQNQPRKDGGNLQSQVINAWNAINRARSAFSERYPQLLHEWCTLVEAGTSRNDAEVAMADRLNERVQKALRGARNLGLEASPEAAVILDAAEPLAMALGGPIRVAVARCQRELELHHRRTRDERILDNFQDRNELDRALEELLERDERWALHYVGAGGVGKTMFLRHLQSKLASKFKLATARVDFDHLSPDYPLRQPGLLLLGFAEELKLEAPESAIDYFRKLELEVNQLHRNLESFRRTGRDTALGFDAPGFEFCQRIFIDALHAIQREGRRPVLILDTCEELARLRFDGKLPRTVVETFRILENLHERFPAVRVIFSGRRPLACAGAGWSWSEEELPERKYLLICPIQGFDKSEALEMLQHYKLKDREPPAIVPREFHDPVLDLSKWVHGNVFSRLSRTNPPASSMASSSGRPSESVRYNPFDIALYAGWVAADNELKPEKLKESGRHYYVRERIVVRLRDDLQQILPCLILLRRFDEALVRDLSEPGIDAPGLWSEIRQQEWTDLDRGAGATAKNEDVLNFWNLDAQLRERLELYFVEELPGEWSDARRKVGDVLERVTIDREWGLLTPSYFDTATELLRVFPERAATWWGKVEAKILQTGEWDWASRIIAAIMDPYGNSGPGFQGTSTGHPLEAPIRALHANVQMRSLESESLDSTWSTVSGCVQAYPDSKGRAVLQFRAAAGLIAHLRYRADILQESYAREVESILSRIPPVEGVLAGLSPDADPECVRQVFHTELALLDNTLEVLEEVTWSDRLPAPLRDMVLRRANSLAERLSAQRWLGPYIQRVNVLAGISQTDWSWHDDWHGEIPATFEQKAFDWIPPRNLDTRRLLECGRILEAGKIERFVLGFCEAAFQRGSLPLTLDDDRLLSQALRLSTDITEERASDWIRASVEIATRREECQAHRKVPPLFVTVIQVLGATGRIDEALKALAGVRSMKLPGPVVHWLDRVAGYLNRTFLLATTADDPDFPELPVQTPLTKPVDNFFLSARANLIRLQDKTLTAENLDDLMRSAEAICLKHGFQLPLRTEALSSVPAGWRPWFARVVVIRIMSPSNVDPDEFESIKRILRGYYGTELPKDVAFLEPQAAPPSYKPASARWQPLIVGLFTVAIASFVLLVIIDRGAESILGGEVTWWQDLLLLLGIFFLVGLAGVLLPIVRRVYVRLASDFILFESSVAVEQYVRTTLTSEYKVRFPINLFVGDAKPTKQLGTLSGTLPYKLLWLGIPDATAKVGAALLHDLGLGLRSGSRVRHLLGIPDNSELIQPCWEAILSMRPERLSFNDAPFMFRRTSGKAWRVEEPFPGTMNTVSISSMRNLPTWNGEVGLPRNIAGGNSKLAGLTFRNVGVAVVQADITATENGIRFAITPGSDDTFNAHDVARMFPNLRLFILLGPDRSEAAPRTLTDRLVGNQMRAAAHELFNVAAPAVISIPGLPSRTTLVEEVLQIFAKVFTSNPTNAVPRLQTAVRLAQDHIFTKSTLIPDDATELAHDVCFYAADVVNMKINPNPIDSEPERTVSA